MDRLEFEAEARREGYRVVYASLKPNLAAPNHCHDFDTKLFILGGEITLTRDNEPETFRAGQCYMMPAGCMHAEHVGPGDFATKNKKLGGKVVAVVGGCQVRFQTRVDDPVALAPCLRFEFETVHYPSPECAPLQPVKLSSGGEAQA